MDFTATALFPAREYKERETMGNIYTPYKRIAVNKYPKLVKNI